MLVHGSHPSSGGRISQDLLATYVRYKQDTRAIIAWLLTHGTRKYRSLNTISIRDLLCLAETVRKKAVEMPESIDFQFRQAIAARAEISRHFRQNSKASVDDQETATLKHEFFTTSLTQIYTGLCECCPKPEAGCKNAQMERCMDATKTGPTNRFAILTPGHHDLDCPLRNQPTDRQRARKALAEFPAPSQTMANPELADPLSDMFEIQKEVQEMNDLLLATTDVWEQAACQTIPIVLAAFITNAAFAMFEGVEQRLKILCDGSDPDTLQTKFLQMRENLAVGQSTEEGLGSLESTQVEALRSPWHLLLQLKKDHLGNSPSTGMSDAKLPSHITLRRGPSSAPMDRQCYATILANIRQHMTAKHRPRTIVLNSTPLFADVGYLLTHEANDTNGLRCAFGVQLILEAYKSYLPASSSAPAPSNCRLQALKFAQELSANLDPVLSDPSMPCRCCQTLAAHLEGFKHDLTAFYKEKVFDLYFQSPWVSGSHMLEMLETSFYFGLRLFSYRHYCGSILHVYNVLRTLTPSRPVPLLDYLSAIFADVFFPGGRPTRNFQACCMRHMGGRLRFSTHSSTHRSGTHKLEIPTSAAKATAGFGLREEANDSRFQYRKISLLHHIKRDKSYHIDPTLWKRIQDLASRSPSSSSNTDGKPPPHRSTCTHHPLHPNQRFTTLQHALTPDLSGPFPAAKINFFKIYTVCVRIIEIISNQAHSGAQDGGSQRKTDQHESADQGGTNRCLCFLEDVLTAADRYVDSNRTQAFGCKGLRNECADAIMKVLGEVEVGEFLWAGI